jgi:hypothetical protein
MELNEISIINTKFGAILSSSDTLFLNNLIYIAAYEDKSIEVTSNTLIFNWKVENKKYVNKIIEDEDFKKDSAGVYYFKLFLSFEDFKTNILEIVKNAFEKINK